MFDILLKSVLPPGVTPELLMEHLGQALQKVAHVAAAVDAIQAEQATQGAMLRQIIANSQAHRVGDFLLSSKESQNVDTPSDPSSSVDAVEPGGCDTGPRPNGPGYYDAH